MFNRGGRSRLVNWWALDAWVDSGVYGLWEGFKDRWNAASTIFARFRLTGFRRLLVELLSEAATMLVGGLAVMLVLAQPAFEAVKKPDWLNPGKYSVTFLDRDGNEIGKRGLLRTDAVPLEEVPDHMIKALLATEDRRFFEHYGVDVFGTLRALIENLRANEVVQGGSSLTQQLAKNLFLSSERSIQRKIKEAFLALWLEARLSKKEILKLYLDRAYMGGGAFGVEAASQIYFGKSVRDVTLAEAAMLAGLFKAPTKFSPHVDLAASRARADEVLTNMVEAGFMTEGQVHGARLNPATPVQAKLTSSPDWFMDWAYDRLQSLMQGKTDYVVIAKTTVDLEMQHAADATIETLIKESGRERNFNQSALVSMEPDGAVRAIVGGRDYGEGTFNRATQAKRQAGSTFKPYVYLTALEQGWKPTKVMQDTSPFCRPNHYVTNFDGGSSGRNMQLIEALTRSTNTIAVKVSHAVGIKNVVNMVHRLGIETVDNSCTMALGTTSLSPLEHTSAYAVFANGGHAVHPYAITEIHNTKGDLIYSRERDEPPPRQVVERQYIEELNTMLRNVVFEGTARAAELDFTYAAGKTGTTSSFKDAWFLGFTGKYVTGIWVGNDDNRTMNRTTGGSVVAPAWKTYMTAVHTSMDIPQIPGLPLHPVQVAEQQRLAALKAAQPAVADAAAAAKTGSLSDRTKEVLKALAGSFRKAGNLPPATAASTKKVGLLTSGGTAAGVQLTNAETAGQDAAAQQQ